MPAVSKKQQKFFGIVRAIQKGEMAPTTPETAKAAADMKKGDVKKFASTKHKGLPEKKKIEEDRQINKIIKQLRKSVKSHKKQADTLEKKVKTFKESNFSNITVGNKVGQTFQHTSGATITLDGALGGKMMVPSQVTIEIPGEFGEGGFPVTVDGPSESDFGLAGFTKPLDIKLQKRIADQSVAQINDRLDASRGLSGAETARVSGIPSRQDGFGGGQGNRTNRRGSAFNKDGSVNLGAKGDMTYKDVTDALNAIADKYNKKRDPLYAAIRERRAGTEAADKIDAYNRASEKEEKAVYDAWDEFNKQQNPDLNLPQDIPDSPENPGLPDAKSDADAKAGYEKARKGNPDLPSWDELSSDLKLPDIPKEGWTYLEYMAMYDALGDAAARLLDPIVKEKLRYGPTGFEGVFKTYTDQYGQRNTPIGLIDAESAIIDALTRAQGALTAAWEAYNKAGLPPEGGGGIETTPVPDASNPYGTPPGGLDDEDNEDEDKDNEDEDKDDEEKDDEEKKDKDKKKKDKKDDTSELGDTQGEFMPSNPQGMRQQGVGKSANDLGRHSPGTSAQQPKTKGGQGGRRLGSTTSRQGGAYGPRNPYGSGTVNTNTPTGLGRVFGGAVDALTGGLTDFDNRGGKPTGLSRVLAGTVDAITGQKTDLDQRGSYLQAIMKAGTKLPKVDKYQSGVNTAIRYDRFLHKMGKNNSSPSVKGSTPDNRIDITNEISKKDKNYVETELNKEAERTSKDKVLTFNNSLEALSKSDTTESDINDAKKTVQDIFAKAYLDKAGLVATFGGTGDPKTGENPALPEVLDVRDRGNYYEVDFGKSYAFREGGSEPDVKGLQARFLKAIKAEPDTIGSDTISSVVAPVFAKLAITGDDKYFRKKNDPYSLYNSPGMHYKVTFKIKKNKKVNESKLSFKLIQQFREESNPRIPRKKGQPANSKKHSDLYTDENPKGTIHGLGFKDVATSKASVSKIRNSSRSHAHKIQAAVAMEQRAREMGKTSEAAVYRKYINSMKKKTKKMNEAANPAQQAAIAISMKKKGIKPKNLKEEIKFAQMQQRIRDAKEKRREQQKKSEKLYIDTKRKGVKFYDKKGSGRLKDGKKIYD